MTQNSPMNTDTIELPRHIVNQLLEQALSAPDTEICGLIAGIDGQASQCYPVSNVATKPKNQFQLDPKQQIATLRNIREKGQSLYAIYHSHPSTPATPSIADIEQMNYPDVLYFIISLHTTGTLQIRAYHFVNNTFQSTNVSITDPL